MNKAKQSAVKGREDISQFIVHLTRDDSKTFSSGGATAKENFARIIKNRIIGAYRPHCLYNKKLETLDKTVAKTIWKALKVACFTEVPLNQLHRLVGEIPGRTIKLEPYGIVFKKEFIIEKGGQPAIYVNSYGGNNWLHEAVDKLFDSCVEHGN